MIFYDALSENGRCITESLIPENMHENFEQSFTTVSGFTITDTTPVHFPYRAFSYKGTYSLYGVVADECYQHIRNDYTEEEALLKHAEIKEKHPGWGYLAPATLKYNCHSYCWISKSPDNIYWLRNPEVFAKSSYFSNYGVNTAISGADSYIIIYGENGPVHSVCSLTASKGSNAISYMTTAIVTSKLGGSGVYQTTLYDVYTLYEGIYYMEYTKK